MFVIVPQMNFDGVQKWRPKEFYTYCTFQVLPIGVYLNTEAMANIVVVKDVASTPGVHISMDSKKGCVIIVEYNNHIIIFQ